MGPKYLLIFFTTLILVSNSYSSAASNSKLGEKRSRNHQGPSYYLMKRDPISGELRPRSEFINQSYINQLLDRKIEAAKFEWNHKVKGRLNCSDQQLNRHQNYIRYLNRLLIISYLFESVREHNFDLYRLGLKNQYCQLDLTKHFKQCRPRGPEMKVFVERMIGGDFDFYRQPDYLKLGPKDRKAWLRKIGNLENSLMRSNLTRPVVIQKFQNQKGKNAKLNFSFVEKSVNQTCLSYKKEIEKICSEQDQLFGLSKFKNVGDILVFSHVFKLINKENEGQACLGRFRRKYRNKEKIPSHLETIIPMIYAKMMAKGRYLQGEMFVPGALQEFERKGVADLVFTKKKVVVDKNIKIAKAPKVVVRPKLKKKKIVAPKKIVAKKIVRPAPLPKKKKKKISQFALAHQRLIQKKLKRTNVNMKLFKKDFKFSQRMLGILKKHMAEYQTQKALKEMKIFDALGSQREPMRLLFLKYLIDTNNHHALFNIVHVLGQKFFVINDIDKVNRPALMSLSMNKKTGGKWQITLLKREPKKVKNKKK